MPTPDARALLQDWLIRHHRPPETVVETHASVVAITGDRVFKIKKAVEYPFLDLSTAERRLAVCRREVELNRRLAPDVYLGIVAVTNAAGIVVDHAVEMVRLPQERRLDSLLNDNDDAQRCLVALARLIARLHAGAGLPASAATVAGPDAVRRLWQAGFDETEPYVGTVLDPAVAAEVQALATRYVAGRDRAFEDRIAAGRIVDGHGDLRADDVFCLADGLRVVDCLEFDDRLRHGDTLADVAFLAMDLEWLGRPDLAAEFLAEYRAASQDSWPVSLQHHWVAYRAHVRAKVACLRVAAGGEAKRSAQGHLALARQHLRAAQVRLVLIGGLPGTGKTTLARGLADRLGWTLLRSDVVRRELPGAAGRYTPQAKDRVYEALLTRARGALAAGEHVVLDASWSAAVHREAAAALAESAGADLVALRCVVPTEVAAARIEARQAAGTDESQADLHVARTMAHAFSPWPAALVIDTADDPGAVVDRAVAAVLATG